MVLRDWLQPPRRLIALFLLVTLVPLLALVASGWRLLEQDQALSLSQLSERREQAADLAVSELERFVAAVEQGLRDPQALRAAVGSDSGIVGIVIDRQRLEAFPSDRLPFYPLADAGREAPSTTFVEGEVLEFRQDALPGAIAVYRRLARSNDDAVRAGALIRLARTYRKSGQHRQALDAYAEAAQMSGVAVGGVSVDLLAQWARCELLDTLQRSTDLLPHARALYADLMQGRWHIDRTTFDLHLADAKRWASEDAAVAGTSLALAGAVESLWHEWQRQAPEGRAGSGRRVIRASASSVTVLWTSTEERLSALLADSSYVESQWLSKTSPALDRQRLRLTLSDAAARPVSGDVRRAASDTGLPWSLVVSDVNPQGELARVSGRTTLWFWGLALLAVVTTGGIVIIARSVMRDLAVARLQSDFVAAVSHEFRTPLTSLRQLTEVLVDGRVTEEKRDGYYRALERQTDRLQRLVESLLDFGRMEAGTSPYRMEPLDACALIRSVVDDFEHDSAANGHHVELRVDGLDGTVVAGDREALTHAVWNLLDNAVKYSPQCETVWVDVERAGQRLAIHVRDRGLGVPRDEHADIFRKFVRGAGAKALGIKGTGIGLAMVQHIVAAHGGTVAVSSEPGAGSTFTLLLPTVDPCPAS
jgi:signal transduction histidine kinase